MLIALTLRIVPALMQQTTKLHRTIQTQILFTLKTKLDA